MFLSCTAFFNDKFSSLNYKYIWVAIRYSEFKEWVFRCIFVALNR